MEWVWALFAVFYALYLIALRSRLSGLKVIDTAGDHEGCEAQVVLHHKAELTCAQKKALHAFMLQHDLDLVDIVPSRLSILRVLALDFCIQTSHNEHKRFERGFSCGFGLALSPRLLGNYRKELPQTLDYVGLNELAGELKYRATLTTESAILPGASAVSPTFYEDYRVMQRYCLQSEMRLIFINLLVLALVVSGLFSLSGFGLLAFVIFNLKSFVATAGMRFEARGLLLYLIMRLPIDISVNIIHGCYALRTLFQRNDETHKASRRYKEDLHEGTEAFFHPKVTACPLCASSHIGFFMKSADLLNHKPGEFVYDRCTSCGHSWQNPQLNSRGLDFYYRDVYSGAGEAAMEYVFGFSTQSYHDRLALIRRYRPDPGSWLDVGMGQGHFCHVAQSQLIKTRFDGIDLSDHVEKAAGKGWIHRGFRGLFPELSHELKDSYEVVTMSHYLEHTADPRRELASAMEVLKPGGHLMIEVPNPDCPIMQKMGRFHIGWLIPQHLHLLNQAGLSRLLKEAGFREITWQLREANQRIDFLFMVMLMARGIAPFPYVPWMKRSLRAMLWYFIISWLSLPFMAAGFMLDLVRPWILRAPHWSNTMRVLAVKP
jgi:SAM-dependent methyltransferase